ncbi:MAG: tRNA preQ1(34) S-adenosylmethionine ribosyltransferase-isomerase QueA [Epsilonproteobacteria bacterium]|nr:tRNA preQ1(34) S-adenosylmethionine ribosyltransferase-isomerase QueA [Campylobacterota bacterium]
MKDLKTTSYDYNLPPNLIAKYPVEPRDSAKLLVYDRKRDTITHTIFRDVLEYIPKECDIFINNTKVIKARIFGRKRTGAKIELLFNKPLNALEYLVMIRGRVKIGTEIFFDNSLVAKVIKLNGDGSRVVRFEHLGKSLRFEELIMVLDEIGHIPLPPYMKREDKKQDEIDYQSVFAKNAGAVASPTASLHFTPKLFQELKDRHKTYQLTLHIGAGTFKPVDVENILEHPMHSEYFEIPNSSAEVLDSDREILAIGTTVTRTIEYYARTHKKSGECDLFLNPSNPPIRVNHLLTNFHLPKSTLIMLVSAFVGREKTLELYHEAIDREYRFFSYGDAMLII